MKKILVTLLFFALSFSTYSQTRPPELQKKLDSLWSIWENTKQPDTTRLKAIGMFVKDGYLNSQPDSAFYYAQLQYEFSKEKEINKYLSNALKTQGISFAYRGDFSASLEYFQKGLKINEDLGDKRNIAGFSDAIGSTYRMQDNSSLALEYFQKALKISRELGDKSLESMILSNIAAVYNDLDETQKAIEYAQSSLEIYEEIGNKNGIVACLTILGLQYSKLGNYPESLDNYQRALSISETLGNKRRIADVMLKIGMLYEAQEDYIKALDYYNKSLKISRERGDKFGQSMLLMGIGICYAQMYEHSKAIEYFMKSLELYEEMGNKSGITSSLNNIGKSYIEQNDYTKALDYLYKALKMSKEIGNKSVISNSLSNIGDIYRIQGNYSKAIVQCQESLLISKEIGLITEQMGACECLYETYKAMKHGNEALDYYEKLMILSDSINNDENTKKITQLEMQYEFDKKEATTQAKQEKKDAVAAQKLKQQKTLRNGFIGGFVVVLFFAGVFFTQRNRIGKEKKRSEELLLNILPAEVAEELKQKGEAEAKNYDMVSILFTDFKSFTEQSEKLTAAALVKGINNCFKTFDAICEEYNIEKIKTIGDAYMAAGGLPVPEESSVKNTVLAALEMQAFIVKQHLEKYAKGEHAFQMRVGIHTGPVVAGIVGVKKFQYDIWGDTVNTASRIESNGDVGKVNISEATYNYLKDDKDFVFESRGKVQAKGKGEIEMYFVSLRS